MDSNNWAAAQVEELHGFTANVGRVVVVVIFLVVGFIWSLRDPVIPDADDCAARGEAADCWKAAR